MRRRRGLAQAGAMTTITSENAEERADRVHSLGAVLASVTILTALLVGAAFAVAQAVQVAVWAFSGS
jgi:hypothetical protein